MSQKVKALITTMSAYYGKRLDDDVVQMYAKDLSSFNENDVEWAMNIYRSEPKNRQMFLPAQLIEILQPAVDDDSLATEAATRIIGAVRRYGYTNAQEAQVYIGPVGWRVVELNGGWSNLCKQMHDDQIPALRAQYKALAVTQIKKERAGHGDTPPDFQISNRPNDRKLLK